MSAVTASDFSPLLPVYASWIASGSVQPHQSVIPSYHLPRAGGKPPVRSGRGGLRMLKSLILHMGKFSVQMHDGCCSVR